MLSKLFCVFCLGITATLCAHGTLETPSGLVYTKSEPQLEFNFFKTYDKEPEEKGAIAMELFPQETTTYVYAELEVKNLLHDVRDHEYKLTYKFYLENGKRLGETSTTFLVQKDWENAWYWESWGWESPGKWPLGKHRVEVWIDDVKFAVREFTVVSGTTEE